MDHVTSLDVLGSNATMVIFPPYYFSDQLNACIEVLKPNTWNSALEHSPGQDNNEIIGQRIFL